MKIIKPGEGYPDEKKFECDECGCVFTANCFEYTSGPRSIDGEIIEDNFYSCRCPNCGVDAFMYE